MKRPNNIRQKWQKQAFDDGVRFAKHFEKKRKEDEKYQGCFIDFETYKNKGHLNASYFNPWSPHVVKAPHIKHKKIEGIWMSEVADANNYFLGKGNKDMNIVRMFEVRIHNQGSNKKTYEALLVFYRQCFSENYPVDVVDFGPDWTEGNGETNNDELKFYMLALNTLVEDFTAKLPKAIFLHNNGKYWYLEVSI